MKNPHDDKSVKHWETRPEESFRNFRFKQPYERGLKGLRDILENTNFDPATLWQWGTMQATALIEVLKAVEERFGREGQEIVFQSLWKVGHDIGHQILDGTTVPEDVTEAEWISFFATIVNRIAYASLETPSVDGPDRVSFSIDWCPHQDQYRPFDCRVQRYLVQGMIDAAAEHARSLGRSATWDVEFKSTIPSGAKTCFFVMEKGDPEKARKWAQMTRLIEEKALELARKRRGG